MRYFIVYVNIQIAVLPLYAHLLNLSQLFGNIRFVGRWNCDITGPSCTTYLQQGVTCVHTSSMVCAAKPAKCLWPVNSQRAVTGLKVIEAWIFT